MPAPFQDQIDLHELARHGSREALGRLAQRHIDFVFGVARRATGGDFHLAEDVTQAVFMVLARRAGRVRSGHLCSWLFTTTRNVAANAMKSAARRRYYESRAAAINKETIMPPESGDEILQEHLQHALAVQREADRAIVLMRYVQGMEMSCISQAMGLTETAARKRLQRALDRLRQNLLHRGVVAGSLAVGAALGGVAQPAPAALSAGLLASASTPSATAAWLAKTSIFWAHLHAAAVVVLSLGMAGGIATSLWRVAFRQPVVAAAMAASMPATAPATRVSYSGVVTDPSGTPVQGVRVRSQINGPDPDRVRPIEAETTTDAQGRYTLASLPPIESINSPSAYGAMQRDLIFDQEPYAIGWVNARAASQFMRPEDVESMYSVQLERAAAVRVKVVDERSMPVRGASVSLFLQSHFPGTNGTVYYKYLTLPASPATAVQTDAQGMAIFPRVGEGARGHVTVSAPLFARLKSLDVYSGTGMHPIRAGGEPFVAVLHPGAQVRLLATPGAAPLPAAAEVQAFPVTFGLSPVGFHVRAEPDGSYLLDGLAPGTYEFVMRPFGAASPALVWTIPDAVVLGAGQTIEINAQSGPGRSVAGRAVDDAGQAVEGQTLRLRRMIGAQEAGFESAISGADGRFQFRVAPGEYRLIPGDYRTNSTPITVTVPSDPSPLSLGDVQVTPLPVIRGRLVDASGHAIAGRIYTRGDSVDTAEDGAFEFRSSSAVGQRIYAVSRSGVLGASVVLDAALLQAARTAARGEAPVISLRALAMISGNVVSESATPVTNVGLTVRLPDTDDVMLTRWLTCQRDGSRFTIGGIPSGVAFDFWINAGGASGASARADQEPLAPGEARDLGNIVVRNSQSPRSATTSAADLSGVIRGRVVDEKGQPVIAASVQNLASPGSLYNAPSDTTDQDGRFVLAGLPAGTTQLLIIRATGFRRLNTEIETGTDSTYPLVSVASDLIGKPAPELNVEQWVNGGPLRLSDLRDKVVLLHIGVDTRNGIYPGNRHEIFNAVARFGRQLEVILIHRELPPTSRRGAGAGNPANYAFPTPTPFPTALDARQIRTVDDIQYFGATAKLYGVEYDVISGPAMVLIDKKGLVRAVPNPANLDQWIEKLLAE